VNINIARAVVRKMVNDVTQPERPLIHLIDSVFDEIKNTDLDNYDVLDALYIAIDSNKIRLEDNDG
jgi:hypothetical protein